MEKAFASYSTCQVADAMQALGLVPCQIDGVRMLSPGPPDDTTCKIVGRAHVAQFASAQVQPKPKEDKNFADTCFAGCIAVISIPEGIKACNWGGLMTARAQYVGAIGAVVDGRTRDIEELREAKFPVFAQGTGVHGAKGYTTLQSIGEPITCSGGVRVCENDLVIADINGVVVVPQDRLEEVLQKTKQLTEADDRCMEDVKKGIPLQEAFKKHRS